MNKIIIACVLVIMAGNKAMSQKPVLNKPQTVAYIEKLFRDNFDDNDSHIVKFGLDGKVLYWTDNLEKNTRKDLDRIASLKYRLFSSTSYEVFYKADDGKDQVIFRPLRKVKDPFDK